MNTILTEFKFIKQQQQQRKGHVQSNHFTDLDIIIVL